jgi:hypothetical protein
VQLAVAIGSMKQRWPMLHFVVALSQPVFLGVFDASPQIAETTPAAGHAPIFHVQPTPQTFITLERPIDHFLPRGA